LAFSAQKHSTQDLLFLVPLSLFFLLFDLGKGSLASWDEAIYASIAKGIYLSGDWFTLRQDGGLWLDKPPLAMWATALFYHMFGLNEFSARLFSALCGAGTVLTTYWLGSKLFDRWTGLLAALVLLSSSDFLRFSRFGMLEIPLVFFLSLTLVFFWLGQGRNRYLIFSGIALGLAFMTKGFAAFLVFPVIFVYAVLADRTEVFGRSSYWIGLMIAAAMALPWHLGQLLLHRGDVGPGAFSWDVFVTPFQALDAPGPFWYYYVRILVNKFHPWILVGIVTAPWFLYKTIRDRRDDRVVFVTSWIFVIFALATLFHLKRPWYILPVHPALAVTVAFALAAMFRERNVMLVRVMFVIVLGLHVPYSNLFEHDYSPDIRGIAAGAASKVPEGQNILLYAQHESPAVSFYIGRPSLEVKDPEGLWAGIKQGARAVLVRQSEVPNIAGILTKNRFFPAAEHNDLKLYSKKP
jgi:4-amino-4-deoxy-L-arabinose transferase-like glycosyltransferase